MKITVSQLKKIIKEAVEEALPYNVSYNKPKPGGDNRDWFQSIESFAGPTGIVESFNKNANALKIIFSILRENQDYQNWLDSPEGHFSIGFEWKAAEAAKLIFLLKSLLTNFGKPEQMADKQSFDNFVSQVNVAVENVKNDTKKLSTDLQRGSKIIPTFKFDKQGQYQYGILQKTMEDYNTNFLKLLEAWTAIVNYMKRENQASKGKTSLNVIKPTV